ncbi:accelerated cell death 11 [Dendrobium catenatum]|uniref:Glycolipid transfer protein domain-containing protein n=1 Tax=Dendrobium catenatum TaxID=906689 RepID=A0A2I0WHL5_9ASPA|nr:accelerated cell death 11 [Dendrobium catenatum]PKU75154.1 hypothetical protein MA16_Dca015510 [Dendrobium catenatum]
MATDEYKPLRRIADAFDSLAGTVNSTVPIEAVHFSDACSRVSVLFGCLGIAFKFAEMDYVSKVEDLKEAAKSIPTLQSMLELDIKSNCIRQGGSHSRNLLRVKRGIDMVKVLFEEILVADGNSLKDPASVAYSKVLAPHHGWAIRKAVSAGMYALPSKSQLLKKLNEDEESSRIEMQKYITSSGPVIQYVEELFISRELGIDW